MLVKPEQLEQHLKQGVQPCYLVTGAEPLIVQECADAIRRAARAAGCIDRERFDSSDKDSCLCLMNQSVRDRYNLQRVRRAGWHRHIPEQSMVRHR